MKFTLLIVSLLLFYDAKNTAVGQSYSVNTDNDTAPIVFNKTGIALENEVRFFLYTKSSPEIPRQFMIGNETGLESYNINIPTKIITHGWTNNYQSPVCQLLRNAFLSTTDCNIIVVDWGALSARPYLESASRVLSIGEYVAKMIDFLMSKGAKQADITLTGHSLGAHIIGIAGYHTSSHVAHVVGLDPAGPGFQQMGPGSRISKEDASFVEIIHTNTGGLGLGLPSGNADIYPNGGGRLQPGCGADATNICSHCRAYEFYADLIRNPNSWYAVQCGSFLSFLSRQCLNNKVIALSDVPKPDGIYMLRTGFVAPFGLGRNGALPMV